MTTDAAVLVRLTQLSHRYGKVQALESISLNIASGLMIGLLGPDGVGKSTLLGLIAGSRLLQQGQLEVLGGDMRSVTHRTAVGPRISYMPQGLGKNLYSDLSVKENLDFFGKLFGQKSDERYQRIERLTKATGLYPFLARPAGKLSGGMKQKLGLCCSLIHDPDLLILDEPTTGVDPLSRRQFWQLIQAIRDERPALSVIVSTAYMDEADGFDWLVAMDAGKVLATGSPAALKSATSANDLETAFVRLLPAEKRGADKTLVIPPLEKTDGTPAISATGMTKRFGDFVAVDNVSFDIQAGEIFGFLGSNGCGKTTTMKMLTGLLPLSEGSARLFGNPLDANDLATRKRVGFMTQAFSLYGELSVKQNLILHARLFHLPEQYSQQRIDKLVTRFGLTEHLFAKADSLPLGMRQRLSLAVAVLHEPEMLILDEPTSGVDPVARDEFWEFLIELSRLDKVTIFISTHFMNEALRCDRISLMHAGQVLVYDTPQNIIDAQGANTLEQAFIGYLQDAMQHAALHASPENTPLTTSPPGQTVITAQGLSTSQFSVPLTDSEVRGFSFGRLLAYSYLEIMEVMRDPVRLAFAFLGSAILLLVVAYGISLDVENLSYAVLDNDRSPQSREYLSQFSGSRYFIEQAPLRDQQDLEKRLKANQISLAIEIPPDFGRDVKNGDTPSVSAWIDGANTLRAGTIEGYVVGGHSRYLSQLARDAGTDLTKSLPVSLEPRFIYNPSFESIYSFGPKTPALLLLMFPAILMAVSIAREKEIGTMTNFYVAPTRRLEFLLGKQLPYIGIGMVNFVVLTLLVVFLLQVPLKGSLLGLSLGALLYVFAATGLGLLVSSVTQSQVAAVFATTILTTMPTISFAGFIQPTSTLEGGANVVGSLWPATYYLHLSVAAFTKGLSVTELSGDLLVLALMGPLFVLIAAALLKKQEA